MFYFDSKRCLCITVAVLSQRSHAAEMLTRARSLAGYVRHIATTPVGLRGWSGCLSITGSSSTFDRLGRPSWRCVCACIGPCVAWRDPVIVVGAVATATRLPGPGFGCGIGCRCPPSLPPAKHAHRRLLTSSLRNY